MTIAVCDVGPRDGLQNEHAVAEPSLRAVLVNLLAAAGLSATEDLVYLLHGEGVQTGVDLDAFIGLSEWLDGLLGRELPGQVYRAGAFAPVS